jgi:hypothetical protein
MRDTRGLNLPGFRQMRERLTYGAAWICTRGRQLYGAQPSVWQTANDVSKRTPDIDADLDVAQVLHCCIPPAFDATGQSYAGFSRTNP